MRKNQGYLTLPATPAIGDWTTSALVGLHPVGCRPGKQVSLSRQFARPICGVKRHSLSSASSFAGWQVRATAENQKWLMQTDSSQNVLCFCFPLFRFLLITSLSNVYSSSSYLNSKSLLATVFALLKRLRLLWFHFQSCARLESFPFGLLNITESRGHFVKLSRLVSLMGL